MQVRHVEAVPGPKTVETGLIQGLQGKRLKKTKSGNLPRIQEAEPECAEEEGEKLVF